jgi:hypothetical protein
LRENERRRGCWRLDIEHAWLELGLHDGVVQHRRWPWEVVDDNGRAMVGGVGAEAEADPGRRAAQYRSGVDGLWWFFF